MKLIRLIICLLIILNLVGCKDSNSFFKSKESTNKELNTKYDVNTENNLHQKKIQNKNNSHTTVRIFGHYDEPETIHNDNTLILEGVSNGEYIEIIVEGKILEFNHIKLEWDDEENDVVEKEIINSIDVVSNQIVIIKTYMPEGIPLEKITWKSIEGEVYEFTIHEVGFGENKWEFDMN